MVLHIRYIHLHRYMNSQDSKGHNYCSHCHIQRCYHKLYILVVILHCSRVQMVLYIFIDHHLELSLELRKCNNYCHLAHIMSYRKCYMLHIPEDYCSLESSQIYRSTDHLLAPKTVHLCTSDSLMIELHHMFHRCHDMPSTYECHHSRSIHLLNWLRTY